MPTVDYLPIANGLGANVESQAQYVIDLGLGGALVNGYEAGLAHSNQMNKTWRQSSMVAAAIANLIANTDGLDVLDDGNLSALISRLTAAITSIASSGAWATGEVKLGIFTSAPAGWIMCNDGTIGDAASGATYANADAHALFLMLWTNVIDTWAPVVGGRGGSAAADWAAHKKITLTQMLGRSLAVSGAGSGLSSRALGQNLGEEAHALSIPELPVFTPTATVGGLVSSISGGGIYGIGAGNDQIINTGINPIGGGQTHNTMQPTSFLNAMIKL